MTSLCAATAPTNDDALDDLVRARDGALARVVARVIVDTFIVVGVVGVGATGGGDGAHARVVGHVRAQVVVEHGDGGERRGRRWGRQGVVVDDDDNDDDEDQGGGLVGVAQRVARGG